MFSKLKSPDIVALVGKGRKRSELNPDQDAQKLNSCPSLLEYIGYTFNFHTLLAGPACTLKEYVAFVDGSNFKTDSSVDSEGKVREYYYTQCLSLLFHFYR